MCKLIKKKAKYLRTFKCQYFTMYVDLKVAWIKLNQKAKKKSTKSVQEAKTTMSQRTYKSSICLLNNPTFKIKILKHTGLPTNDETV